MSFTDALFEFILMFFSTLFWMLAPLSLAALFWLLARGLQTLMAFRAGRRS